MLEKILKYLPKIDEHGVIELLNIIKQSSQFDNHLNSNSANNEFELQYAQWLGTGDESFVDTYKSIVEEACFAEFLEWYEYITKHLLNKDVQQAFGFNIDVIDSNWKSNFQTSELIGWAYKIKDYKLYVNNIDKVKIVGEIITEFFNKRNSNKRQLSIIDDEYFDSDHAQLVLDSIEKIIINNDRTELIHQLNSEKVLCMIEVYGWNNRFNPILLNWIYKNKERISTWN